MMCFFKRSDLMAECESCHLKCKIKQRCPTSSTCCKLFDRLLSHLPSLRAAGNWFWQNSSPREVEYFSNFLFNRLLKIKYVKETLLSFKFISRLLPPLHKLMFDYKSLPKTEEGKTLEENSHPSSLARCACCSAPCQPLAPAPCPLPQLLVGAGLLLGS